MHGKQLAIKGLLASPTNSACRFCRGSVPLVGLFNEEGSEGLQKRSPEDALVLETMRKCPEGSNFRLPNWLELILHSQIHAQSQWWSQVPHRFPLK